MRHKDLSLSLHTFTRLAYHPHRLVEAMEAALAAYTLARPDGLGPNWLCCPKVCVKLAFSMATFGQFLPRLYAALMRTLRRQTGRELSHMETYEATVAHMLATATRCAPLATPTAACLARALRVPGVHTQGA